MARKPKAPPTAAAEIPPVPSRQATPEQIAAEKRLLEKMEVMVDRLTQRNLDAAVALAQQAARRQGPLVEHFQELGRRFGAALDAPRPKQKPKLRVVEGGAGSKEARIEAAIAEYGGIAAAMRAGVL